MLHWGLTRPGACMPRPPPDPAGSTTRMAHNDPKTARKLAAFSAKHTPSPNRATTNPAIGGPITRAALKVVEFRLIAFSRSSLPTRCTSSACRPGTSNALATPKHTASTNTCQICTHPPNVNTASNNACPMAAVCATITIGRRRYRSATKPVNGVKTSIGI